MAFSSHYYCLLATASFCPKPSDHHCYSAYHLKGNANNIVHRRDPRRRTLAINASSGSSHITGKQDEMIISMIERRHAERLAEARSMWLKEVVQVSNWWKELGLTEELEFARNEPMKWYMWPLAMLTDPKLSEERVELAKPISFVYLIDDIFDVYGSLDELTLFTEIVNGCRWDIASAEQLPDYIWKCFMALHEVTTQIGSIVYKRHGWNPIPSLQQAWAKLFKAFLVEAKWFEAGECPPSAEEYLKNGIVSSGVQVVLVHLFFLLGQGLTERNVELVSSENPPVISSVARILRLSDDLSATIHKEETDGNDGSYLDCYLKENPESSIHDAKEHVLEMIEDTWKRLNHESLSPTTPFPLAFNRAAHNLAKMVPLMYGCDDIVHHDHHNQAVPMLEDHIKSMLFESFPF